MNKKTLLAAASLSALLASTLLRLQFASTASAYTVPGYTPYVYPSYPDSISASVVSPNGTYDESAIPVTIDVNVEIIFNTPSYAGQQAYELSVQLVVCRYSLDGGEWKNIPFDIVTSSEDRSDAIWQQEISRVDCLYSTVLNGLSVGEHFIKVNAYDSAYSPGDSRVTQGNSQVDIKVKGPVGIFVLSPTQNETYDAHDVHLNFRTSEHTTWTAYSLDNQEKTAITGNITLSGLSNGSHSIMVFANDSAGNTGSSNPVQFLVNVSSPSPPPSPSPTPQATISPAPSQSSPQQQTSFLGASLPMEYDVAIVAVVVILVFAAIVLVFRKRFLQSR